LNSILNTIKKLLGLTEEQKDFDIDILILINSAFSRLTDLGLGPEEGFSVEDEYKNWSDFIQDSLRFNDLQSYVYLKVKMVFDPPASSAVLAAYEKTLNEIEWLLNVRAETNTEEE
jgi:hypothetical protein